MNVEIELKNTLNKSQIELDYYNRRDKMKTQLPVHVHDNVQTT